MMDGGTSDASQQRCVHDDVDGNLGGLVYVPYPKGSIEAAFHVLQRELKAIYKL